MNVATSGGRDRAALRLERLREPAIAIGALVVAVVAAYFIPSGAGTYRYHAPLAILFGGMVNGLSLSLLALSIILVYRTLRVINLAANALGIAGAALTFNFVSLLPGVPFIAAFLLGLAMGAVTGAIFEFLFGRRFAKAPRLVLTIATIFAAAAMTGLGTYVVNILPFFPAINQRSAVQITGGVDLRPLLPFGNWHFTIGDLGIRYGFPEVFTIAVVVATVALLAGFLYRTRMGKAIQAMAVNPERAQLLGISVTLISLVVWSLAGTLSTMSLMLTGFMTRPAAVYASKPEDLLAPLAAAILARMSNLTTAVVATIAFGVIQASITSQQADLLPLLDAGLFIALVVGLLFRGRRIERSEQSSETWAATEEPRPVPHEMARMGGIRITRVLALVVLAAVVIVFPFVVNTGDVNTAGFVMLECIAAVSLVVITGWGGQASGGQFALVAIGSLGSGYLTSKLGLPWYVAILGAILITAVVAGLLAYPALRVKGLFLIVTTYAFAVAFRSVFFNDRYFHWLQSGLIHRPSFLFFIDLDNERNMYFFCFGCLLLAVFVVFNLRRTRFGRVLIAVRENDPNAQSAAIGTTLVRISAFVLTGALAGFAGGVLTFQQQGVDANTFDATTSFFILEAVVVGGASSVSGAITGVIFFVVAQRYLGQIPGLGQLVALIPLIVLYISPGGLWSLWTSLRDGVLRIIAERNRMVVPSLYADIDPESLALRLVPLGPSTVGTGLDSTDDRYRIESSRLAERRQLVSTTAREGRLLGEAAKSATDAEENTAAAALEQETRA